MTSDAPLKPIAEAAANKVIDTALDNPLQFIEGMDSFLSVAAKLVPTTPDQFPIPIPLGIYEHVKGGTK